MCKRFVVTLAKPSISVLAPLPDQIRRSTEEASGFQRRVAATTRPAGPRAPDLVWWTRWPAPDVLPTIGENLEMKLGHRSISYSRPSEAN
jgi:hypothetical protein